MAESRNRKGRASVEISARLATSAVRLSLAAISAERSVADARTGGSFVGGCGPHHRGGHEVGGHSDVVRLRQADETDDPLAALLRAGARHPLAQAVEPEVEAFLTARAGLKLPDGRARLVRHGHAPERAVQTGTGAVAVARPEVRDRGAGEASRGPCEGERASATCHVAFVREGPVTTDTRCGLRRGA